MSNKVLSLILLLICVAIFVTEPQLYGFDIKGHLGWVPSHTASQIIKASFDNWFVGYAFKTVESVTDYSYFDRYPFLFAGVTKLILSPFESNLSLWVLYSKYWMNLIFVSSILCCYRISGYFLSDRWLRLSSVLLSLSGFYFMNYKSMIHFDQPAILGTMILVESIFYFEKTRNKNPLIWSSLLTPLMGRGYVNLFVLSLYLVLKLVLSKGHDFKNLLRLAFLTIVPATLLCSSFLAYNIYIESEIRNVPIDQVSIVMSAKSRLGLDKFVVAQTEAQVSWTPFILDQGKRLLYHLTPYRIGKKLTLYFSIILFSLLLWKFRKLRKIVNDQSLLFGLLLVLSGFVWIFPMKRLAAFHDYTTMYYWGLSLFIYMALLKDLKFKKTVLVLSVSLFITSLIRDNSIRSSDKDKINMLAAEFEKIRSHYTPGKVVYVPQGIKKALPGRPYILGFYFYDSSLTTDPSKGDYKFEVLPDGQLSLIKLKSF